MTEPNERQLMRAVSNALAETPGLTPREYERRKQQILTSH